VKIYHSLEVSWAFDPRDWRIGFQWTNYKNHVVRMFIVHPLPMLVIYFTWSNA